MATSGVPSPSTPGTPDTPTSLGHTVSPGSADDRIAAFRSQLSPLIIPTTPSGTLAIRPVGRPGTLGIGPDRSPPQTGTVRVGPDTPDPEGEASVTIGDGLPEETIAALEHGRDIVVLKNHYVDPISGNVFTINYGGEVSPDKWEDCTRALIGNVWHRVEDFLMHQGEHTKTFKEGLKDIESYTFNWRTGVISLHMKGGTTHLIAAGHNLRDAIKPFLTDPKSLEGIADPVKMTEGLGTINPQLSSRSQALLVYLACNPHTESRLESAIASLNRTVQKKKTGSSLTDRFSQLADKFRSHEKEPVQAQRYRVILETLRALKTGAQTQLDERERELLEKGLQPAFRFKEWIVPPKVDQDGDPWLQKAADAFQTQLDVYAGPTLHLPVHTVKLDFTTRMGQAFDLAQDQGLKTLLSQRPMGDFEIDLKAPAAALESELGADPHRVYLHIEPRINISLDDKNPRWAEVTQISCLISKEGTKQADAHYAHFVRHGDKWWHMGSDGCKEVPWSTVQQVSSLHASKIAFHVPQVPIASLSRSRAATPATPTTGTATSAPSPVTVLSHGPIAVQGFQPAAKWDTAVLSSLPPPTTGSHSAYTYQEAIGTLREYQAKIFADDARRPQHLAQLYFPALHPILAQHPEYRAPDNTFTPAGRIALEKFFLRMSQADAAHTPAHSLCYFEMQEMANASKYPIVVITGPDEEDRMLFIPEGTTLATGGTLPEWPPLFFGAPSISKEDPTARASLTALIPDNDDDFNHLANFIKTEYDNPDSKYRQSTLAPSPRGPRPAMPPSPSGP